MKSIFFAQSWYFTYSLCNFTGVLTTLFIDGILIESCLLVCKPVEIDFGDISLSLIGLIIGSIKRFSVLSEFKKFGVLILRVISLTSFCFSLSSFGFSLRSFGFSLNSWFFSLSSLCFSLSSFCFFSSFSFSLTSFSVSFTSFGFSLKSFLFIWFVIILLVWYSSIFFSLFIFNCLKAKLKKF